MGPARGFRALFAICVVLMLSGILVIRNTKPRSGPNAIFSSDTTVSEGPFKMEAPADLNQEVNTKPLCRSLPEYSSKDKARELSSRVLNGVEAMLLFIGYPRSGHTLIGSLLDAHPNIVVANEFNVLETWVNYSAEYRNKGYLFQQLYLNSYNEANKGDRSSEDCVYKSKYNYLVQNQWQGKFNQSIKIIGDKKGGRTSLLLTKSPIFSSALNDVRRVVDIPIKFIHVVRNPFDNIATMILRKELPRDINRQKLYENPLNLSKMALTRQAQYYMRRASVNKKILRNLGKNVLTVKSEAVIINPRKQLLRICKFLNVSCFEDYLRDCASIVYGKPSKTRNAINWDRDVKNNVLESIKRIPFLRHYKFNE